MKDIIMNSLHLEEQNVQSIDYVFNNNHHFYFITLVSRGSFCPHCHSFSKKIHSYKDKRINHALLLKDQLTVIYRQRRYICPNCGRTFIESNPFVSSYSRFSSVSIDKTLSLLKDYNQTFSSVARLVNISVTQVIDIFDRYVQIDRKPLQEVICIDEFYFSNTLKTNMLVFLSALKMDLFLMF